mmetsp:Transcript_51012/g.150361  ORF Transcript_51012/g.150361 Transcript_51012/m.150361 type:complete len:169 (+) Transcript_51012:67-573(+)
MAASLEVGMPARRAARSSTGLPSLCCIGVVVAALATLCCALDRATAWASPQAAQAAPRWGASATRGARQTRVPMGLFLPPTPRDGDDERQFEWFFTSGEYADKDIKLKDLPRPSFLPEEFWDFFYEKGYFLVLFQAIFGGLAFIAIFKFAPFFLNAIILSAIGKSPPA